VSIASCPFCGISKVPTGASDSGEVMSVIGGMAGTTKASQCLEEYKRRGKREKKRERKKERKRKMS
jgi:hypothetical protein